MPIEKASKILGAVKLTIKRGVLDLFHEVREAAPFCFIFLPFCIFFAVPHFCFAGLLFIFYFNNTIFLLSTNLLPFGSSASMRF
jgi:hypothetical protein